MKTKEFNIRSNSRLSTTVEDSHSLTAQRNAAVSRSVYVLSDGAIKKSGNLHNELNNLHNAISPAIKKVHNTELSQRRVESEKKKIATATRKRRSINKRLTDTDNTQLSQITSTKAKVWLQKLDKNKLAVQWNVPQNIRRNCQDLLFGGAESEFVLRLYQNISVGSSQWKTSQRTLEYAINISKRKCYINLKNGGGKFTAEIGIRCADGRYVFISRSKACSTACFNHQEIQQDQNSKIKFTKAKSRKKAAPTTPNIFVSKSDLKLNNLSEHDLNKRDIVTENYVNSVYQDFLREGPKVLRRRQKLTATAFAARAELLQQANSEKASHKIGKKAKPALNMQRLDSHARIEESYQQEKIKHSPERNNGYIPQHLESNDVKASGIMIGSMRNTAGTVAIDVFKKNENKNPRGTERKVVKVQSKKALAQALKKSGIHEKSELILSGKVAPGRKVRIGGLLIETEKDGSFCVACAIKEGKLHVPVEEVEAIIL